MFGVGHRTFEYLEKDKIIQHLKQEIKQGVGDNEVIIIMGAGNIYKLLDKLL